MAIIHFKCKDTELLFTQGITKVFSHFKSVAE